MAKKFKKDNIDEPGTYQIRLHHIEDGQFEEVHTVEVFDNDGYLVYHDWEFEDSVSSIESLEESWTIFGRRIK
jgi:hypothetical protein